MGLIAREPLPGVYLACGTEDEFEGVNLSYAAYLRELGYDDVVYHYECEQRPTFHRFDGDVESNEKRYAMFVKELDA